MTNLLKVTALVTQGGKTVEETAAIPVGWISGIFPSDNNSTRLVLGFRATPPATNVVIIKESFESVVNIYENLSKHGTGIDV